MVHPVHGAGTQLRVSCVARMALLLAMLSSPSASSAANDVVGVTTTIFAPTPSVLAFAHHIPNASLVVVADKKTDPGPWITFVSGRRDTIYLPPDEQAKLAAKPQFSSIALLPWNHFGRKNVGFLFAISRGVSHFHHRHDIPEQETPKTSGNKPQRQFKSMLGM